MEINKKTRAVRRATHGELDPESFSRRKLVNALEELNSLAVSKGFEAITQDTDALTQFPSSYVIDSRTETIHLKRMDVSPILSLVEKIHRSFHF